MYDIKAYDEQVHINCTGHSNKIILDNLKYIDEMGKSVEVRIPYVPNYNSNEIDGISGFLSKLKNIKRVRVPAYHNLAGSKYESLGMECNLPEIVPSEKERADAETAVNKIIKNSINEL